MDEALRQRYQELYRHLSRIHVCNASFDHLIGEFGISTTSGLSLLETGLSFNRTSTPLRMQLMDISGIASNGLSHYLAYLWSTNSDRFGMSSYKAVFVLSDGNLKTNPKKPKDVKKALLTRYQELTAIDTDFEVTDVFWRETLFIVANYSGKELRWLNELANVLVIGERYLDGVTPSVSIPGFACYDVGLCPPKMGIFSAGSKALIHAFYGQQALATERKIRDTFLMRISEAEGVIDYTNPHIIREADGKLSILGMERRVKHKFPLVRNLADIICRVIKGEELGSYNAQVLSQTSDWYAAAVTAEVSDDLNDSKELYSYNIGGNLLVRNGQNNYFSNLGPINVILPIIIEEIRAKIDEFMAEVIHDSTDSTTLGSQLMNKVVAHLETKFVLNTESGPDVHSLSLARVESPLASSLDIDPSYKRLAEQVVADQATLSRNIREILSNKATRAEPFVYTLIACLFVAEPARCQQTLLPTIMMLDLCEEGVLSWADAIFQTNLLVGVSPHLEKALNSALISFSGSFPMTQKSSFLQAKTIKRYAYGADRQLMTWVEYKSSAIMMKWFELSNQRIRTRPSEEAAYWEATIFGRFNDRLANFARIGTPEFGMQISTDFTHLDRRMGEVRTLDESQKRYLVVGVRKGYPLPIYDRSTGKRISGLEDSREGKVFSDTSTLDYGSSDEETVDETIHSPPADETSKPRTFRDKIRKEGYAIPKSPHDFHKCTVHKPLSQRNPITEKVTGILHSHTDRVVAYRDARAQYIVNRENSSKSSFSR